MGLCCLGLSSGVIHDGLSWTWNIHELSDELVCGKVQRPGHGVDEYLLFLELLVCSLHSHGNESDFVSHQTHYIENCPYSDFGRWKLYMIFMTLCFTMAIVVFFFYLVSTKGSYSVTVTILTSTGNRPEISRRSGVPLRQESNRLGIPRSTGLQSGCHFRPRHG